MHLLRPLSLLGFAALLGGCTYHLAEIQEPGRAVAFTTTGPWRSMIYAARTDSGVMVVDLGWAGAGHRLRSKLRSMGVEPGDVTDVFLTHSHRDHIAAWRTVRGARFHLWLPEQPLFEGIEAVHRSGVKFIPVGSVNSSGSQIVNPWFRQRFKDLGTPVISGHIRKLVFELKNFLA